MRKTLVSAIALSLALGAAGLQAAPRITAEVNTKADASLTGAEQRAVSVAAGRLLRHAYEARGALEAKDKAAATENIDKALSLVAIIEQAVPSYTVKSRISAGDLSYEDEDSVKPTIIPIFDELDKVSLIAPLRQAKAEKDKQTGETGKPAPVEVAGDVVENVRVSLDLGVAKAGLSVAKEKLAKDDTDSAERALAMVMASLSYSLIEAELPLDRARENLMLAKAAIEDKDTAEAKAVLAEVGRELDAYAKGANEADRAAIATLRKEMSELSTKLKGDESDKGLVATIEGWWDRIGELMK